jgi:pSer/pThr/pTyr-binding forkhead associated (FHA) protein
LAGNLFVSRTHLILRAEQARLIARDLGSRNGTERNGHPLTSNVEVDLVTNDTLALGAR